jgi:hypothetical protein
VVREDLHKNITRKDVDKRTSDWYVMRRAGQQKIKVTYGEGGLGQEIYRVECVMKVWARYN